MKISQALKEKNKIVRDMRTLEQRMSQNNSYEFTSTPPYDSKEVHKQYLSKTHDLIDLKTKISSATQPILPFILKQGELKNQVAILKRLNIESGFVRDRYGSGEPIRKTASIKELERDELVAELEKEIDKLQDDIDTYNATTDI